MAEILTYSQSLTSLTGGRGDYTMHFLRYEEVPSHIAQKVIDETTKAQGGRKGMIVKKVDTQRTCGVCDRTLLLGERATRYSAGRSRLGRRLRARARTRRSHEAGSGKGARLRRSSPTGAVAGAACRTSASQVAASTSPRRPPRSRCCAV